MFCPENTDKSGEHVGSPLLLSTAKGHKMKRILGSIVDIRKGEFTLTFLMFIYYYLVLVAYYLLKPARDGLFLVRIGPEQLPIVFILIALVALPMITVYVRLTRFLKLTQLMNATTAVLIASLLILRWLIQLDYSWVYYVFYIWVAIYGITITSQFWLLANTVFNPAQAKRLFVLLNLGGIFGAFTGGEVTSLVVRVFGMSTENLLFLCIGFLTICIFLLNIIWTIGQKESQEQPDPVKIREQGKETLGQMFRTIRRSRQLMLLVGIISLMVMTASFVDFQFKTISAEEFPAKEDLTSFLGKFYGRLSLVALLFQSLFTYRFLRVLGVGGTIMFLPIGLLFGSVGMLIAPGLWAGIFLRGVDRSLGYSINKTGFELLSLPVPMEIKKRTKIFIDVFVERWSRGIAGALLLLFTVVFGFSIRQISILVIALLIVWILFCILVRKEYVNAFRKALEGREIDLDELRMDISEASTVNALIAALASTNERQVVYALDLLTSVKDAGLLEPVQRLLKHRSSEVRRQAVRVLGTQGDGVLESKIEELLKDDDQQVRLETMLFLCRHPKGNHIDRIKGYLEDPDLKIQAAAIGCIAEYGLSEERHLIDEKVIQSFLDRKGKEGELGREQMAKALGRLDNPSFRRYLFKLMEDPSPRVVRQAIESSGRTRDQEFVALLIEKLSDKRYRADARMALAAFGSRILDTLNDYLRDETVDVSVSLRGNIARVLSEIPAQKSVDILIEGMKSADPTLKYHLIKALNKLRARYQQLRFDQSKVDATLIQETKSYYEILQIQDVIPDGSNRGETQDGTASKLLKQVLIEKQEQSLERIFRLLGLRYPPKDMYSAYQGIVSSKQAVHASAIEFLDTVLNKDIKKYLFPFLDQVSLEITIQKGQELFRERIKSKEEALVHLIRGRDAWLRACAIYNVVGTDSPTLMRLAEEAQNDLDPVVRETANMVLNNG